jgi:hypothetical protein
LIDLLVCAVCDDDALERLVYQPCAYRLRDALRAHTGASMATCDTRLRAWGFDAENFDVLYALCDDREIVGITVGLARPP